MRVFPLIIAAAAALAACSEAGPSRSFEFRDEVKVPAKRGGARLWIPVPPSDAYQKVELVEVRSERPHRVTTEPEFANKMKDFKVTRYPEATVDLETAGLAAPSYIVSVSSEDKLETILLGKTIEEESLVHGKTAESDEIFLGDASILDKVSQPLEDFLKELPKPVPVNLDEGISEALIELATQ